MIDWGWGGPGAAYGLYIDTGGDDSYSEPEAQGTSKRIAGWGLFEPNRGILEANAFATYVDIGGNDIYLGVPNASIRNDNVWNFGVDRA